MKTSQNLRAAVPVLLAALLCAPFAAAEEEGPEEIRERGRLQTLRHGGTSDPETHLRAVKAEYAARLRERERGPLAIGGTTWTSLGPTNGAGRMTAIAPHPTTPGTVYVGAADGGVWKTTDGGVNWVPLTDDIPDLSVGALAVAPSVPDTLYLGSGEGGLGFSFVPGIGFLKSTDAGATWQLPASVLATQFYKLSVHPTNALELVAGTNGGGYRSTNGGGAWTNVIAHATYGDITEVVRHPTDPTILYAAGWGGSGGSKVLKSTDSGTSWTEKSNGLPVQGERLSLAIAPSNPLVLYAATAFDNGSGNVLSHVYKTTDGGENWVNLPGVSGNGSSFVSHYLGYQAFYDNTIVASPTDAGVVIAGGVTYIRSTNGSSFARTATTGTPMHVDAHDLRYQGSTLWVANDGGINVSTDGGAAFTPRNAGLVTRQYYALADDPVNRNRILAGSQDNGTDQRTDAGGTTWRMVVVGDGFEPGVDPVSPEIAYGSYQHGSLLRSKNAGASDADVAFLRIGPAYPPGEEGSYAALVAIDPSRPAWLYTGSTRVWRSTNGGDSWAPLPTTTTDASSWNPYSVFTIAIARSDPSVLMVAKNFGVYRSTDGGTTWVSAATGLPTTNVNNLEIDPANPSLAYAAVATTNGQSVYRTTNAGASWQLRSGGLPSFAAQVVRVDPTDANVLYAGTDVGVYRSPDQGGSWTRFGTGLPAVSSQDIRIFQDGSALRVATHGRGVWQLDVPAASNRSPAASISSPAGATTVAKGTVLTFTGSVSDPDADPVAGAWLFPDTWEMFSTPAGAVSRMHRFDRAGVFPVALGARDAHGARAAATRVVTVPEPFDACASPRALPGSGPFPYAVLTNTESATGEATDPDPPACSPYGDAQPLSSTLWFSFTPAATDTYEVSICGAGFTHVLSAYTGPACGPYTQIACSASAPAGAICTGDGATILTFPATSGETVRILVSDLFPDLAETFALTIRPANQPTSAPRLTNISQQSGPTTGGSRVVLTGASFVNGATVSFGGAAATDVALDGGTLLFATAPAHAAGAVDVAVTNPDQSKVTLSGGFRYVGGFGDADGNGTTNVSDVLYLINHLYAGGPAPVGSGDVDGNGAVNVSDVLYLINYLFAGGPPPA